MSKVAVGTPVLHLPTGCGGNIHWTPKVNDLPFYYIRIEDERGLRLQQCRREDFEVIEE